MGLQEVSGPQLGDIIGQGEAIDRLQCAMHSGRVPHAFLFAGPVGVGRRTTGLAFAATLLCESPVEESKRGTDESPPSSGAPAPFRRPCGRCEDCRMMNVSSHPDFHMIYKELARYHDDASVRSRVMQDLGIDVIRSFLIDPAYRAPSRGRGKIFVVVDAELMSVPAQNALLKTLEEPPAGVRIILIASRPDQLLPTTLSRCSLIRFSPLPREFIVGKLLESGLDEGEADFWAAYTEGSLGRALVLSEQGMYEIKRDVIDRISRLGSIGDAELAEHLAKLCERLAGDAMAAAKEKDGAELSKLLATRQAAAIILQLIASAVSDALTLATAADKPIVNTDQRARIDELVRRFAATELAEIIMSLNRFEQLLWANVNPKIIWDNVVITCASPAALAV